MTFDEYTTKINDVLSTPDTALANIGSVMDELKSDLATLETLKTDKANLEARVRDLQDTNIKLYLAQTSGGRESDEGNNGDEYEDMSPADVVNSFIEKITKEED